MEVDEDVSVVFGPDNLNWSDDQVVNQIYLRGLQNFLNQLLEARGHVFLNEVYDELRVPRTSTGALCGWVRNGKDFIHIKVSTSVSDPTMILDFNIQGIIYDKI